MQLSVACNLIPEGVRMLTGRWIISHRCCWMAVYVSCCNAQSNLIVIVLHARSVFYQLPICNLFTQHVIYLLWRNTSSELWTPVHFSLHWLNNHIKLYLLRAIIVLYFTANISFHTIRLILCIQQTGEIDNLTELLGQSILVVLCAGSTLLLRR